MVTATSKSPTPAPAWARASSATMSRLSIGNSGRFSPRPRPCATAHEVRKPVNAPGPRPKATASMSGYCIPARSSSDCNCGSSEAEACAPPAAMRVKAPSGVCRPSASLSVEVSNASTRKACAGAVGAGMGGSLAVRSSRP